MHCLCYNEDCECLLSDALKRTRTFLVHNQEYYSMIQSTVVTWISHVRIVVESGVDLYIILVLQTLRSL